MDNLRKFAKSRLGQFSMLLIVAPMAFLGLSSSMTAGSSPDEIVKIGEQGITLHQLQTAVNNQRSELIKQGIDRSLIKEDVLQQQILKNLINRTLLEQQAQKLGLSVSDATITHMLTSHPDLQDESGNFSNDLFAQAMTRNNMTKDQLFAQQRAQMSVEQLSKSIVETAIYPMSKINKLIDLQLESRDIWLYRIPWQNYQNQVSTDEQQIEDYYNQHTESLKSIPMVDLSYIQLTPTDIEVAEVSTEELEQQYQAFKQENNYTDMRQISQILLIGDDAQTRAKEIKTKLDEGMDFAQAAKQFSDDPTGDNGGDIGQFDPTIFGDDEAVVSKALAGLKVGDISEPVQTSFGYQIFTVTEDNSADVPELDSIREQLKAKAIAYKQQSLFTDKVTQVNELVADGFSIQDIAQQEGLTVQQIKDYKKQDNHSALSQPNVIESAFDEFTIQDQSVAPAIETDDGMLWIQSANYRPIAQLSLEEATPTIRAILIQQKATKIAVADAEKLAENIKSKTDIAEQAVEFKHITQLTRENLELTETETHLAFSKKAPADGVIAMVTETDTGASLLVANAIETKQQPQVSDDEKQQVASTIRNNFGQDQLLDYLDYLNTVAQVKIDQKKIDEAKQP